VSSIAVANRPLAHQTLSEAKLHFRPQLKWWVLVQEGRKCFIFQWGLTGSLSAISYLNINEFGFSSRLPERTFGLEVSDDLFRDSVVCRAQIALCFCICALHPNEIPGTDPLVQVDYVRVVDLDIGASKWDNLRDQSGDYFD